MEKKCEACGRVFECRPAEIHLCQCASVHLTESQRKILSESFYDCLCQACLAKLAEDIPLTRFSEG